MRPKFDRIFFGTQHIALANVDLQSLQIGVIGQLGREAGVPTPAIDRLVELIHDIEDGRRALSRDTMPELFKVCA